MLEAFLPYGGMFITALLAATIVPLSSDALFAVLITTSKVDVTALLAVAAIGNTLGAVINWVLGKHLYRYRDRSWYPVTEQTHARAERWFARFGVWSLLFSWAPLVGDPLTLAAGALRVKFLPFLLLVAAGKTARYGVIAFGGNAMLQIFP